jgi:hypothetical protein
VSRVPKHRMSDFKKGEKKKDIERKEIIINNKKE